MQLALYSRRYSKLSTAPHPIHFTREMRSKLGWVDHQQGLVVGVSGWGRPIEAPSDHGFVVDYGELVVQFVAAGKTRRADCLVVAVVLTDPLRDSQDSPECISPNPMQGRGILKNVPRLRDNSAALQARLRLDWRDHFINHFGRWADPVAQARQGAIFDEIWRDALRVVSCFARFHRGYSDEKTLFIDFMRWL